MQTVMFTETIFGPIHSRRLGTSLGVNLNPRDGKICSFDCLYCEAGFNAQGKGTTGQPDTATVSRLLEEKLSAMSEQCAKLDVITFSGNGEPTVNPHFPEIIDETLRLRDKYYPEVKVSVLTNSTMLQSDRVVEALRKVDNAILKLDSAKDSSIRYLDRPVDEQFTAEGVIERMANFGSEAVIQTMICRSDVFDNSTEEEVAALIEAYKKIKPRLIMLYSIDRPTPDKTLQRVDAETLKGIAQRITAETGIPVQTA